MDLLAKFFGVKKPAPKPPENRVQTQVIDIDPQGKSVAMLTKGVIDGHPFQALQTFEKGNGPKIVWPQEAQVVLEPMDCRATVRRNLVKIAFMQSN